MKKITVAFALVSMSLLLTSVFALRSYAQAVGFDPVSTIGIWLFEEEPELVVKDSSGNGRDGTIVGDPAWVQGRFGKALKFDGNGDYLDLGADLAFSPETAITICACINVSDPNATNDIVTRWGTTGGGWTYVMRVYSGTIRYQIQNISGEACSILGSKPSANTWYHVAMTYDGSELRGYLDGLLDKEPKPLNGTIKSSGDHTAAGARWSGGNAVNFFKGMIDDLAMFNVALSENDIKRIAQNGLYGSLFAVSSAGKLSALWGDIKSR